MSLSTSEKLVAVAAWIGWLVVGLLILCVGEDMHVVTALYVLAQVLTTIGYGDVEIQTQDSTKIFMALYSLVTALMMITLLFMAFEHVAAAMAGSVSRRVTDTGEIDRSTLKSDPKVGNEETLESGATVTTTKTISAIAAHNPIVKARHGLLRSIALATSMISIGTLVFSTFESCSCSYGESSVEGCDPDDCAATGGYQKSVLDAFYMSCISLTTVGFGDYAPKSLGGRLFACVWMVVGVVSLTVLQVQISNFFYQISQERKRAGKDLFQLFNKIDKNRSGELDKYEFLTFCLAEYGLVSDEDIDTINNEFERLDASRNGSLSMHEVLGKFDRIRAAAPLSIRQSIVHPAHSGRRTLQSKE